MIRFKTSLSIALLASAAMLLGCAAPVPPAPAAPAGPSYPDSIKTYVGSVKKQIKTINMEQFRALVDKKEAGLIVDVRQENEFEDGFVPGAVNVPRGLIEFRIWKLVGFPGAVDMNKQMTLYCATGGRCALATKSLQDLGFTNVTSVDMVFDKWVAAGHPVAKPGK